MEIVGKNGKPLDLSKAKVIDDKLKEYKIGEVGITTAELPQTILVKAQQQAQGLLMQQGQMQAAAHANPFQFEPCALAVFMMLSNEVARLNGELDSIRGKMDEGKEREKDGNGTSV